MSAQLRSVFPPYEAGLATSESACGEGIPLFEANGHVRSLDELKADIIRIAIRHYRGQMSEVARRLGIGRSPLYRKLAALDIQRGRQDSGGVRAAAPSPPQTFRPRPVHRPPCPPNN